MYVSAIRIAAVLIVLCMTTRVRETTAWAQDAGEMITVNPQTLTLGPVPNIPSCAKAAPVRGDPSKGAFVLLIKMAAGCRIPWHWHTPSEQLLVVSGTGLLETKDGKPLQLRPGAYASLPSHHVHRASCSSACTMFNVSDGAFDIHYVDQSGNEIPADAALQKPSAGKTKRK